ncbi:hypothetical protein, partial [uncultured Escherichia sp.]|uniref:hypothetical protein n=1 Tax=uncultured Escherichia sp. TaxID=237777 RepID=UPI00266F2777
GSLRKPVINDLISAFSLVIVVISLSFSAQVVFPAVLRRAGLFKGTHHNISCVCEQAHSAVTEF